MKKGKKIYEGKAKILYKGPEKNTAIQLFKDHATAFNNQKKSTINKKGIFCLLYTSPSPRDLSTSRMPSSA